MMEGLTTVPSSPFLLGVVVTCQGLTISLWNDFLVGEVFITCHVCVYIYIQVNQKFFEFKKRGI